MSTPVEHLDKWKLIQQIDLRSVKDKFLERKGWWWSPAARAEKTELEYRQFLYLMAVNPGKIIVPWNQDLDDFWHEHILDTRKYAYDCENVFGQFMHHNPGLPKGTAAHTKAFNETKELYKDAFSDRKKKDKEKVDNTTYDSPGCSAGFIAVFCSSCASVGVGASCGSHSDSGSSGSSCSSGSSGSSCGSSCSSSCGGGGCGGGGD